ncbi:hypothetical protein [Aureimonas frigidaquae]|uniref:hypothetical protein n=1 Tax=Aureimonas frigidaquae TaxID=424757 RepID=UPI0012ED63FC|nr:hypothetical protein [Aureimonas frigidaquae]
MDYDAPAELTWRGGRSRNPKARRRKSFEHLWQAVCFVISDKSERRGVCKIVSSFSQYEGEEIEELYARRDFPVRQRQTLTPATFLDRLFGARTPKYRLLGDTSYTWTIIRITTGMPVEINGVEMARMSVKQAEEMLRILNGPGEADMLALGP